MQANEYKCVILQLFNYSALRENNSLAVVLLATDELPSPTRTYRTRGVPKRGHRYIVTLSS
jgi:hypothetical protein